MVTSVKLQQNTSMVLYNEVGGWLVDIVSYLLNGPAARDQNAHLMDQCIFVSDDSMNETL